MNDIATTIGIIIGLLLVILVYGLPAFIAFYRRHEFRWIILAINIFFGPTGLGWLIALIWAIYPKDKSLADPVFGNPTGLGNRNSGNTLGEIRQNADKVHKGAKSSASALDSLDRLAALAEKGVITSEEFAEKKARLLSHI